MPPAATPSPQPQPIRALDAERVRLPLERDLAQRLSTHPTVIDIRNALALPDPAAVRRRLMGGSLRLSEGMAPELHANANATLRTLGIAKPLEIYQSSGQENAAIHLIESPILIEVQGRMITLLDRGSMAAVIGHELGHYLAHGPWGTLGEVGALANALAEDDDIDDEVRALASTLSMAKELTADRFGLLACQDLAAVLRLEMISTTGLPGDALTWDTEAYLSQCRDLMEQCLREGSTALGVTHPEHNLRAYAAWLFSESTLYRELTGRGPGTRSIDEVNATLARTLALPSLDPTYQMLEAPPPEVHACALACAVLVADADGEIAEQEADAIERVFAPLVPEFRRYFEVDFARRRFQELRGVMAAFGPAAHRSLFTLLAHVVGADGVIDPRELECVVEIGDDIGAGALFRSLLRALLRSFGLESSSQHQVTLTTATRPVPAGEARAGLDAYLSGIAQRGGGETTVRRLLRLMGERKRSPSAIRTCLEAFARFGIQCASDLESIELDAIVTLTCARAADPSPVSMRKREPLDRASQRIAQGLTKLRDQLVSGDGRSPSVRIHAPRVGRAFDLSQLERISVGLSERVLAKVRAGSRTPIVSAADAGSQDGANAAARELLLLDRENRSRIEETGANDLALGYPFIAGNAGGYFVRGPLVLHPVDLERDERGARGFSLRPRKDSDPVANQALLRVLFAKRGFAYADDFAHKLDELAADPSQGAEAILRQLAAVGLSHVPLTGTLSSLEDRRAECERWGAERLVVEECAVLGLFPQSSSDLLQDYDALIDEISSGRAAAGVAIGGAVELLPTEIREAVAGPRSGDPEPEPTGLGVPVIAADPSQQAVIARARSERALVVDGPPGTGKSQVIVNLVADALGRGLRVAVVSEKRAALDVVAQRLQQTGLSHAVALVHDVQEDRKPLYSMVAARLEATSKSTFDEPAARNVMAHIESATAVLDQRSSLLGHRAEPAGPTVGQLHALTSSIEAPIVNEPWLSRMSHAHLSRAQSELACLRPYAELFTPNGLWRADRASLAPFDPQRLAAFERAASAACRTADSYERLRSSLPGLDPDRIAAAREAIESARGTRSLRSSSSDQAVFVQALATGERSHEAPLALANAEAAWAEGSLALARVGQRVTFDPGPAFEGAAHLLRRMTSKWWRVFSFAWWRARGVVRDALLTTWPEQAGAPLTPELLDEILLRMRASRAWRAADACLDAFGVRHLAAPTAEAVGGLITRVAQVYRNLGGVLAARSSLQAVGAWIPRASVDSLGEWDRALEQRVQFLQAYDAHRAAATGLDSVFPWLGALPSLEHLQSVVPAWQRDALRVAEADRRLVALGTMHPNPHSLFHTFVDSLGATEPRIWSDALARSWGAARLADLERQLPELRTLDGATPHGDEEATAEHLGTHLRHATEHERARVSSRLDAVAILQAAPAEKGRRRTADQATRESMLKECRKQRMIMPLRTFVRRFADSGLLDAAPVWLLSPETMAVLFPRQPLFDLVIFDEASQCTVENGVPVVVRAKRVVIAGDEKQMPPTSFFTAKSSNEDDAVDDEQREIREVFDGESLLTMARSRVPHIGLQWHYRCLDEELIAFSNHSMYDGTLLTAPSTASRLAPPALRWVGVPNGKFDKGRNEAEAAKVVEVVAEMLQRKSPPTVGVVTFNVQQRQAILDEIDRRRAADAAFAARWDAAMQAERLDERPFVKNLENVQGDERDAIVFSPAYAPVERVSAKGTERVVPARFGPLGLRGGERRLNVAISRAKRECVIVASFEPSMLSVARTKNPGPTLFRDFLEFAYLLSNGKRAQAEQVLARSRQAGPLGSRTASQPLPGYVPVKGQIALALQQLGLQAEIDVGTSAFRVPLAVSSRGDSTRYALAVLCDEGDEPMGAVERHVHRPGLLRARGWKVLRVTAREWARDPGRVLAKIRAEVERAPASQAMAARSATV